jgi:hypothetical protein
MVTSVFTAAYDVARWGNCQRKGEQKDEVQNWLVKIIILNEYASMNSKSVDQITNMINAIFELLKGWMEKPNYYKR